MKRLLIGLLATLVSTTGYSQEVEPQKEAFFTGEDLSLWQVPPNNTWWSVEGGVLHVKNDPELLGSILWTKAEFTDFMVELEFKFGEGTIDSGIFMRGDDEHNPQIQIGESGSLKRDMTASPYVPKSGYPVEAEGVKELLRLKDWNTIKAMAKGNEYRVWLNGKEVMNYQMEDANLKGAVGLQLHPGREMTIQFKNIFITRLK